MLVVVSKIKQLIKKNESFNTSAEATVALSEHVENIVLRAIVEAKKDGRKTVMKRDIDFVISGKED